MAQNEALFRDVNERIRDLVTTLGGDDEFEYFCECANADCTFRLPLRVEDYESIRNDPKQFVVLPGHYTPEIEDLVMVSDGYLVVRKSGEAGELVEQLDPRSR